MMGGLLGVIAAAEAVVASFALIRFVRGPSVSDRIVALNTASAQLALAILVLAAAADRPPSADVAIWLAGFSYLGTMVWARYLERGLL